MTVQAGVRELKADAVRARVIEGVVAALNDGRPLTFKEVASAANVPERTVYRYFPTRTALLAAVFAWTNDQIGFEGSRPTTEAGLLALVRQAFRGFDDHAAVVRQMLIEPDGRRARVADVDDRRRAATALVGNEAPDLDPATRDRVAAAVQVLTVAATWQSLHEYWDLDGEAAAEISTLAIELILEAARARALDPQPHRKRDT
jgi:AcrR family transcriptional regulator